MPKPATLDHLRSAKKPVVKTVVIPLDSELVDRYEKARSELEVLRIRVDANRERDGDLIDKLDAAQDRYDALRAEMEENSVEFKFHSIGRPAYEALLLQHPPTKEQKEAARKVGERAAYNADTFPPALLAASSFEPKMELHEAEEIWKSSDWNQGELMALFMAAVDCNQARRVVELGKD